MCSRHAEPGAGNPDWLPRPFRVLVCDRYDQDDRRWIKVPAAIGLHDALSQVRTDYPAVSVLTAEEVS